MDLGAAGAPGLVTTSPVTAGGATYTFGGDSPTSGEYYGDVPAAVAKSPFTGTSLTPTN